MATETATVARRTVTEVNPSETQQVPSPKFRSSSKRTPTHNATSSPPALAKQMTFSTNRSEAEKKTPAKEADNDYVAELMKDINEGGHGLNQQNQQSVTKRNSQLSLGPEEDK